MNNRILLFHATWTLPFKSHGYPTQRCLRPEVQTLLEENFRGMLSLSQPESVHALGPTSLRQTGITFWSAFTVAHCG